MDSAALRDKLSQSAISPYKEMVSYELIYFNENASLKRISELTVRSGKLPSQAADALYGMVLPDVIEDIELNLSDHLDNLSIAVNNTPSWPSKLADAERPSPLLYYYGDIGLMDSASVSIVGSRKASDKGLRRAAQLARDFSKSNVTVVSGLARGIDTAAMQSAVENDGRVIGVIGTPIDEYYPKENRGLQDRVAEEHLLISQVPFYKYAHQPFKTKRYYFPERNELMAAVSDATVIVEASDTSGTLTQARACMHQGRKLFILRSCFEDASVSWPKKWAERENVFIADSTEDILSELYSEAAA